jgi:hypothetical protein
MRKFINKHRIFIIFALVVCSFFYLRIARTYVDRPFILSDKTETIEAVYVAWACDCPNWLSVHHYTEQPGYEAETADCFYVEAGNEENQLPSNLIFSTRTRIRFTGKFYIDKGIPEDYRAVGDFKPKHARVFRYDSYELLSN